MTTTLVGWLMACKDIKFVFFFFVGHFQSTTTTNQTHHIIEGFRLRLVPFFLVLKDKVLILKDAAVPRVELCCSVYRSIYTH